MKRSDVTKKRLIDAATVEFAKLGIAGARVDRIADSAGCNKQAIYAYFGSKEGLHAAVYDAMVANTIESIPIDALDLPGYAVRLFDWFEARPEVLRLAFWSMLETPDTPISAVQDAEAAKIAAIRAAQIAGAVTGSIEPGHLLAFILQMSTSGMAGSPVGPAASAGSAAMRQSLHDAVARLVAP